MLKGLVIILFPGVVRENATNLRGHLTLEKKVKLECSLLIWSQIGKVLFELIF